MANIYGRILTITITGQVAQPLGTAAGYAAVGTIPALSEYLKTGIVKYAKYNTGYTGQVNILPSGTIQVGYTQRSSDGSSENIPSGQNVYIKETFII